MDHLILPPRVHGKACAFLQVGCDSIQFYNQYTTGPIGVYLLWWGQDTCQQVCLSPPILLPSENNVLTSYDNHNYRGIRTAVYHIVTEEDQFKTYLADARHLFLQVRNVDDNVIGFSAVEKLFRLIEFGGLRDDVSIFSCVETEPDKPDPKVIGHIRIWMTYDVRNENESTSSENSCNENEELKIIATGDSHDTTSKNKRYNPTTPLRREVNTNRPSTFRLHKRVVKPSRSSPVLLTSKKKTPLRNGYDGGRKYNRKPNRTLMDRSCRKTIVTQRSASLPSNAVNQGKYGDEKNHIGKKNVTFFDQNVTDSPPDNDCKVVFTSENVRNVDVQKGYTLSKEDTQDLGVELLTNDDGISFNDLQKVIIRSKDRLANNDLIKAKGWQERVMDPIQESLQMKQPYPLPSWNLSTERLKYIGQVSQLFVNVKKVTLKPEVYQRISELWARNGSLKAQESPKCSSKSISTLQSSNANTHSSPFTSIAKRTLYSKSSSVTPPTFFVAYSIPPEKLETSFCSKRVALEKRKVHDFSNELLFNGRSVHPIRFNTQVLDSWWTSNVEFKIHCRSLNQRVPTFLGSASLKLKHLLMNEKYTNDNVNSDGESTNSGMRLPIFSSTTLKQQVKSTSANKENVSTDKPDGTSEILGEILVSFAFIKESEEPLPTEHNSMVQGLPQETLCNKFQPAEKELIEVSNRNKNDADMNSRPKSMDMKADVLVQEADKYSNKPNEIGAANHLHIIGVDDTANTRAIVINSTKPNHETSRAKGSHFTEKDGIRCTDIFRSSAPQLLNPHCLDPLICLLRVPEGKGFVLPFTEKELEYNNANMASRFQGQNYNQKSLINVYVACRIFSSGTLIKSSPRQYDYRTGFTSPTQFDLEHCMSFEPEPKFFTDVCKENYLIIESWFTTEKENQATKEELIGISSISLHKMYTSFQDSRQLNMKRSQELPLIITNGWIPVTHLLDGKHVGHIRVLFAVGFQSQVCNLSRILNLPLPRQTEMLSQHHSTSHANNSKDFPDTQTISDGHDSVRDDETVDTGPVVLRKDRPCFSSSKHEQYLLEQHVLERKGVGERSEINTPLSRSATFLRLRVSVEEGRNLPIITGSRFDKGDAKYKNRSSKPMRSDSNMPNTYVTLPRAYNDNFLVDGDPVKANHATSKLIPHSCNPQWRMDTVINCPTELLTDPRRYLILKIWHRPHLDQEIENELTSVHGESASGIDDYVMGFAAIDISPLLREGYTPESYIEDIIQKDMNEKKAVGICGWYNLMDFVGRRRGQVKISVQPDKESAETRKQLAILKKSRRDFMDEQSHHINADWDRFRSKPITSSTSHEKNSVLSDQVTNRINRQRENQNEISSARMKEATISHTSHWKMPEMPVMIEDATRSILAAKMSDLDQLAQQLKAKLIMKDDNIPVVDISESNIKSTLFSTADKQSVENKETTKTSKRALEGEENQTLSQLRISITNQLSLMQEHLLQSRGKQKLDDRTSSIEGKEWEQQKVVQKLETHEESQQHPQIREHLLSIHDKEDVSLSTNSISESLRQYNFAELSDPSGKSSPYSGESPTSSITIEERGDYRLTRENNTMPKTHDVGPNILDTTINTKNESHINIRTSIDPNNHQQPRIASSGITYHNEADNIFNTEATCASAQIDVSQTIPFHSNAGTFQQYPFSPIQNELVLGQNRTPCTYPTVNIEANNTARPCSIQSEEANSIDEERRSRMEPDGARNPSPLTVTRPKI